MKFTFGLLAALALISAPTLAADNGFYVGASFGKSGYDITKGEVNSFLEDAVALAGDELGVDAVYDISSAEVEDNDTGFSFFVGYRFMPYLAVEGAWLDMGEAKYNSTGTLFIDGVDEGDAETALNWNSSGAMLSALGIWPISDQWEVFGRLGMYFADTELDFTVLPVDAPEEAISAKDSESSTEFIWGLGVDFYFLENFAARFEWQVIPDLGDKNTTGEIDSDLLSLGLLYKF